MVKKITLCIVCILAAICVKAQSTTSVDSLAGFDYKEFQHHLDAFKGTETQKAEYIARVKRRYITQKYAPAINHRNVSPPTTQAYDCTNIGFEDGNTTGWTITGANAITSGTGVDPFGNFPVVYPGGGNYSLQLNNNLISNSTYSSTATRIIAVTTANTLFSLSCALDLLDYPHTEATAAKFRVDFFNAVGDTIPCPQFDCFYYQNSAGVGTNVGFSNFQNTACPGNCGTNIGGQQFSVTYAPWQTINVDLTPYLGTNVTCQISCDWCIYDYDFAYCYIDAACSSSGTDTAQITQSNPLCVGGITMLQGPPGMATYSWTGPVTGTTQNLTTSTPGNYTLTTTSVGGSCVLTIPTLYYTLTQTTTASPTVSIVASYDTICAGTLNTLTASGANTYIWSTGANGNSISVSPPNTVTYTIIGTDTATGCAGSATQVIYVNMIASLTVSVVASHDSICSGITTTLTASGANTYTWSTNAGSATTNTVAVSPTTNTTYTVTGTGTVHGCTSTATQMVYIANVTIQNLNDSICEGATASITASGATSYTWSTGATTANIIVTPTVTTSYTVTGNGVCINTVTTTIKVNPIPTLTINSTSPTCSVITTTLTASGANNTYIWNTGVTTAAIVVTPAITTTYTVTGTSVNGCENTDTITVVVPVNPAPFICEVTTDSASHFNYNFIYWNRTGYNNVDSFIIYRYDVISSSYLRIGAVSKDSLSEFKDTAFSIGGPNGGNPLYSSWKYTLAIRDTCGNISTQSPFHQSMFVQESGSNFSWNAYTIGTGQTNPVIGYSFLRDDNNTGNWHVLVNTAGLSSTDPNYASYPNGNWRVDALGFSCTPTYRLAGNNSVNSIYSRSHSNTIKPITTAGINKLTYNNNIAIYPNPTKGMLNVELGILNENTTLQITDMLSNTVKQIKVQNSQFTIDVSDLNEGVYNILIENSQFKTNKRLVIVR
jgi:type IX secretion system substrate protein